MNIDTMNGNGRTLRHDRHTVSMLTDHMVFCPKYRGTVLIGEIRDYAENVIREICMELGIVIMRMAVNSEHIHIFFKYQPKYSVSYIANIIKGKSSRLLRKKYPQLREWCADSLWAPSCFHGSVGQGWVRQIQDEFGEKSCSARLEVVENYISTQRDYALHERVAALKPTHIDKRHRS